MDRCPICGSTECAYYFRNGNDIVGCEHCVVMMDAWEVEDEDG